MTISLAATLALAGSLAGSAAAHGLVQGWVTSDGWEQGFILDYYYMRANGQSYPDIAGWYQEALDLGFVSPDMYQTSDINCHINAEPGALTVSVPAGSTITAQWGPDEWPHPYGPIITYLAACDGDCSTVDKNQLEWVKIEAAGIDYDTQIWASQDLIDNNSTWTMTIPSAIAPGNYVLRHEIIALHGAASENGAQNYPQCFNIEVTGSGTARPSGTLGTQLYSADDPGILFNPYTTITNYEMPGPELFTG